MSNSISFVQKIKNLFKKEATSVHEVSEFEVYDVTQIDPKTNFCVQKFTGTKKECEEWMEEKIHTLGDNIHKIRYTRRRYGIRSTGNKTTPKRTHI